MQFERYTTVLESTQIRMKQVSIYAKLTFVLQISSQYVSLVDPLLQKVHQVYDNLIIVRTRDFQIWERSAETERPKISYEYENVCNNFDWMYNFKYL